MGLPQVDFQENHPGSGTLDASKQVQKEHGSFQNCTRIKTYILKKSAGRTDPLKKKHPIKLLSHGHAHYLVRPTRGKKL